MSRYAVFGHPVAHSLSPRIHAAFAKQAGIAMEYTAIDAAPEAFAAALERFADAGGKGANVTLPLKETACALCAHVGDAGRRAGAVNTLSRVDG
ncbi:MAG TPA: shikimate dehydrogenase, partial [Pseudoxanthomonas sp.]|nr:shikimate dehydrogenase [Pseudoxanthomonas sp.]